MPPAACPYSGLSTTRLTSSTSPRFRSDLAPASRGTCSETARPHARRLRHYRGPQLGRGLHRRALSAGQGPMMVAAPSWRPPSYTQFSRADRRAVGFTPQNLIGGTPNEIPQSTYNWSYGIQLGGLTLAPPVSTCRCAQILPYTLRAISRRASYFPLPPSS